jgi:hypothetical protein
MLSAYSEGIAELKRALYGKNDPEVCVLDVLNQVINM